MKIKNNMFIWELKDLVKCINEINACINDKWVPARPINYKVMTIKERFACAWEVFTGKADAFRWPEGQ